MLLWFGLVNGCLEREGLVTYEKDAIIVVWMRRVDRKMEGWRCLSIEDGVTPSPAILSDQGTMASTRWGNTYWNINYMSTKDHLNAQPVTQCTSHTSQTPRPPSTAPNHHL